MRIVSAYYSGAYPFDMLPVTDDVTMAMEPDQLKSGDILVVWGGGDIPTQYYNKGRSRYSGAEKTPGHRDRIEWALMQRAIELKIPIIGVCRGGQMLCAAAGGYLIQHVNGHGGYHAVTAPDGTQFMVNSIHHQMMMPADTNHILLAHTTNPRSDVYMDVDADGKDTEVKADMEREYIYFPEIRGHAIQWHPEAMQVESQATQFIFNKVEEFL